VDSTGKIIELENVTVKDDQGNTYGVAGNSANLPDTIPDGRTIEVGDIQYTSSGVARFREDSLSGAGDSQIWGNDGVFEYQETGDFVHIYNFPNRKREPHLIDVVNSGQTPLTTVAGDNTPGPTDTPANDTSLDENTVPG